MPAATAAAEPLEDPPGVWPELCGLRVLPGVRVANSVVTVLPRMTAPAPPPTPSSTLSDPSPPKHYHHNDSPSITPKRAPKGARRPPEGERSLPPCATCRKEIPAARGSCQARCT